MSIAEKIKDYIATAPTRFHTPGHKGMLVPEDITELYFSDDYQSPAGIIRGAMDKAKTFYSSAESFLLVNGSTIGMLAAVYALKAKKYIIADNSHCSVYNAIKLAGAEYHIVDNEVRDGIEYPLTAAQVADALRTTGADAVILTSPDYFGLCADMKEIHKICKAHNAVMIGDCAHGAHYPACDLFPKITADIAVMSAHKTMPALTQGSFLNVYDKKLIPAVWDSLMMFASTSPSYLIMSSLEYALDYTFASAGYYYNLLSLINGLKSKYPFIKNDDFTRLALNCVSAGGGGSVDKELRARGIISEKVFGNYIIFIVTLGDSEKTLSELDKALAEIF